MAESPRLKTHLIVDGLPGNIDLPTVEALFSPHAVLSARFFRKPSNDEHGGSRVVAFVRLGSEQAAEESIDKLNGRSVPGWDSSKMKVVYADDETQNEQTASEKRIRELIARQEAHPESPLQQKSINTNDFRYTNASLPKPSFSSLPATSSHTQDVRRDTYQQQFGGSARRGYVINIPGSNETRYADFQDSPASQASPPPFRPSALDTKCRIIHQLVWLTPPSMAPRIMLCSSPLPTLASANLLTSKRSINRWRPRYFRLPFMYRLLRFSKPPLLRVL
ncbi:uncharacterized protein EI90DRAFT_1756263 [Cantharellus anzutake]|uniref:uncharacterized protein n=1 Tax=Cantharellus anzutake TaxID=1750568 RepID=UPI001903704C|nr:uncharacterized protein EI90DRAFT_1756263 [Cantharellus anzutake]KAF8341586.1 hypothetical protein EI90DRAFT_1756263 [Cantharellus anzutake]